MRGSKNLIVLAVLGALSGAVAGCSTANFDPTDMLDFLDTKKKLPGERKPVFPEGVPGLEQGVPKDLYRGSRQQQIDQPGPAVAAAPPPEEPQAKGAKSKGRSKQAAAPTAPPAAADPDAPPEEEGSTAAAPPPPKPAKIVRRRTTAPPPDPPAQQQPAQQQSAFPAPLPSGGFQR